MRVVAVHFDYPGERDYSRLLAVFEASLRERSPNTRLEVLRISPPKEILPGNTRGWSSNRTKLDAWAAIQCSSRENTIFCDCDMLCLRDLSDAFERSDSDLIYCDRAMPHLPVNGGVIFARPTEVARAFFAEWASIDRRMYRDKTFHVPWRRLYVGMNQASFGYMFHHGTSGARLASVSCEEWNACDEHWPVALERSRLVHVKGNLREYVLRGEEANAPISLRPLIREWRRVEMGLGAS